MDLLKKLLKFTTASSQKTYYTYQVKCKRCGEILEGRVDVDNDLSVEYEEGGDIYYCRKVVMGDGKNMCYQQIEALLKFNKDRRLLERSIESGGSFVE